MMMAPKLKEWIKCRRCHCALRLADRVFDWVACKGGWRLTQLPLCDACAEKQSEAEEVKELEKWPEMEETLDEGFSMLYRDGQFGPGTVDDDNSDIAPEESFLMPGEETKW